MQLVVEIPMLGDDWRYALLSDAGALVRHDTCALQHLPAASSTVAVLGLGAVSWHAVDLPKTPPQKLRAALEGALEDRWLDDASALFVAWRKPSPGEPAWAATCNKASLEAALIALRKAGHRVSRVIAAFEPQNTTRLHAWGGADAPMLTVATPTGVTQWPLDATTGQGLLKLLAPDADAALTITAEPQVAAQCEAALGQTAVTQAWATHLAEIGHTGGSATNLAQFELLSLTGSGALHRASLGLRNVLTAPNWRWARWGVGVVAAANLIGVNAMAFKERQNLGAKRALTSSLLLQTFPQTGVILDAPIQMQRQVAALKQAQGSLSAQDFETQLGSFAAFVGPTATPSAIEFAASELTVKGLQLSPDELTRASQNALAQGLRLRAEPYGLVLGPAAGGAK